MHDPQQPQFASITGDGAKYFIPPDKPYVAANSSGRTIKVCLVGGKWIKVRLND